MLPKSSDGEDEYKADFKITELFSLNNVGIVTAKDKILINEKREALIVEIANFYKITPDESLIKKISYRPFDNGLIYFDTNLVARSRKKSCNIS